MSDIENEYLTNLRKGEELFGSGQYLKAVSFWFQALKAKFSPDLHKKILDVLDRLPEQHKPVYLFTYGKQLLVSLDVKVEALEVLSRAVALDSTLKPRVKELLAQVQSAQPQGEPSDLSRELDDVLATLQGVVIAEGGETGAQTERTAELMNEVMDIFKK